MPPPALPPVEHHRNWEEGFLTQPGTRQCKPGGGCLAYGIDIVSSFLGLKDINLKQLSNSPSQGMASNKRDSHEACEIASVKLLQLT